MKPYPTMGVSPQAHERALDRALRTALGTSQAALRKQALEEASSHLIHPRLVLDSPLLTDSHPWRREALAVADALEAVTNGMEEPGVLEALDDLDPGSPFQPWRHLVLALHFFYEGLDEAVLAHVASIPRTSPVIALGTTLEALVHGRRDLPGPLHRLALSVAAPDPRVEQWVQDVAEGLEADDEPLFWDAFADWLETVAPDRPERAQSAAIWAWTQLEWRDFDEAVLLDLTTNLWGSAEAYRLAALGTLGWDPEGAALLWFRFVIAATRAGDLTDETAREALEWLVQFRDATGPSPSPEWTDAWGALSHQWNVEAQARGWKAWLLGEQPAAPSVPRASAQLDLFSL